MPDHSRGAQRASARKIRSLLISIFAALVVVTGATASAPEAHAATRKVVIVVGPVGSATASYKDSARKLAEPGSKLRRLGPGDLQPLRHVDPRPGRGGRGERADLPRSWQWLAEPPLPVLHVLEERHGPELELRQRELEHEVLRPGLHAQAGPREPLGRDAQPAVLRVRQQRVGRREPHQVDRDQARGQLRLPVPQGGRPGGVRERDHEHRLRAQGPVPRVGVDDDVVPVLERSERDDDVPLQLHLVEARRASPPGWIRTHRAGTTAR